MPGLVFIIILFLIFMGALGWLVFAFVGAIFSKLSDPRPHRLPSLDRRPRSTGSTRSVGLYRTELGGEAR